VSLLDKALARGRKSRLKMPITGEHIDLAMAWIEGRVSAGGVSFALTGRVGANVYAVLACALRAAFKTGQLVKGSPRTPDGAK
jgi:hypothetical protein